ncbi:Pch2p [Lachancea thermotolerans CBS 6340]|uniref:KLTH0E12936p n=1 Tax=Lachancea thermotolerans (strain ATCC 56472 / CBS 6340 / NRRL Y-8284) TaxID=559295 RepID=C5DIJ2_LACTC|nr:KLTH0E12936p [Lachancea thermotolerans CBS 6340]CAR23603.1 KLTH0E12936p [Lachancea thermotolerans CBS 6340]
MALIVDVQLKGPTLEVFRRLMQEMESEDNFRCCGVMSKVIIEAVKNKLRKQSFGTSDGVALDSKILLLEGQGSVEISLKPTKAQENIVKSLTKVILHQIGSKKQYNLTEGQENLLLSLCVENMQVEHVAAAAPLRGAHSSIASAIEDIFCSADPDLLHKRGAEREREHERQRERLSTSFQVNCYCCLESDRPSSNYSNIAEEFDKIDIQDSCSSGETAREAQPPHPLLAGISLSQETLSQSKISFLPSPEFEGLWESLHFEDGVKQKLSSYATISLKLASFSKQRLSQTLVSNNKILLIHGPPGTGKTTVCRALCQKLAIRCNNDPENLFKEVDYQAVVVELSCSRIFSRWFGESAKNLEKIFQDLERLLMSSLNQNRFVCLLMDEVETLASSRESLMKKNETTDGIRVVNTLLTKLDSLKRFNNLLVLATSNVASSLDAAFLDRADGVFYIGAPSEHGTCVILTSAIRELLEMGAIYATEGAALLESSEVQEAIRKVSHQCVVSLLCDKPHHPRVRESYTNYQKTAIRSHWSFIEKTSSRVHV